MALSSPDDSRRHVRVHAEHVSNVSNSNFPGFHPGEEHSWNLDWFTKNVIVKVQRLSARSCEFDIVGVDASIVNALRRILIAEVPTIAIDQVYVWNNTSVIVDELLAQRLGLVPLDIDPSLIETKEGDLATDRNTIVFRLQVSCPGYNDAQKTHIKSKEDSQPQGAMTQVLSSDLQWEAQGEQGAIFRDRPPRPGNPDIVLAKLWPGQELDVEMHAVKGIGAVHAKWSPVCVATYRLHPHIRIKGHIPPPSIPKFVSCFSPGVIGTRKKDKGEEEPVVIDARKDAMSREVLRYEEFRDKVELSRIRDWFIFNIESESAYAPERLFIEAISVMRDKIAVVRKAVAALEAGNGDGDVDMG